MLLYRGTEATAHLSLLLTVGNMIFPVVNRGLGLALAEIDDLRSRFGNSDAKPETSEVRAEEVEQ